MIQTSNQLLPADTDKPHRCPRCWKIPEACYDSGRAIKNVVYTCRDSLCGTQWILRNHSWRDRKNDVKCRKCGMNRKYIGGGAWISSDKDGKALVESEQTCPPTQDRNETSNHN